MCPSPTELTFRRGESLQGPCILNHDFWVVLPPPPGAVVPRNRDGSEGRVRLLLATQGPRKGPHWHRQQGRWHTLGPVRSRELSTTRARLLGPSGRPPGLRGHGHTEGPDRVSMPGFSFFIE